MNLTLHLVTHSLSCSQALSTALIYNETVENLPRDLSTAKAQLHLVPVVVPKLSMLCQQKSARLAQTGARCLNHRAPRVCVNRGPVQQRGAVSTAAAQDDNCETTQAPELLKGMQTSCEKFMQRYEHSMLSSGIGAAAVTTWCMVHGQSPGTAAAITVMSTITALVLNEVLFTDTPSS